MGSKMKKKLPPLNWLRSFEASARYLNFTQAASELNLTQAAVSQQVKGLEHQLGSALFKRLPRGLELTDAGLAYLPVVHEAIERLAVATDEIFGQGKAQALTVKVNLIFFTTWLAPKLHQFRELHPEICLRFTSNIWNDAEIKKDSDMEIRYGQGNWSGLKSHRLTWDTLIPVCSPELINQSLPQSPEDLAQHCLLHVLGYEEGWGYWLSQVGHGNLESADNMQFDTLIMALEVAKQGLGIALGRSSLVDKMVEDGELVAPFDLEVDTTEGFYLSYPPHQYLQPHAETFLNWMLEEAEKSRIEPTT